MLGFLHLVIAVVRAAVRDRGDLVAENLLLRQQLAALTRATGPRPRFRTRDELFWLLVRAVLRDRRRTSSWSGPKPSSGGAGRAGRWSGMGARAAARAAPASTPPSRR